MTTQLKQIKPVDPCHPRSAIENEDWRNTYPQSLQVIAPIMLIVPNRTPEPIKGAIVHNATHSIVSRPLYAHCEVVLDAWRYAVQELVYQDPSVDRLCLPGHELQKDDKILIHSNGDLIVLFL